MAFHPLLSLAIVSFVYFVPYVNCLTNSQVLVAGHLYHIDVNSKLIRDLVRDIPNRFHEFANREIIEVISAKGQVASGFKYYLTVEMRSKNSHGPATQRCFITIWDRPLWKTRALFNHGCVLTSRPRHILDTSKWARRNLGSVVRQAATYGMSVINSRCNCYYLKLVSKINKVQIQVSSVLLYTINVTITDTVCHNTLVNLGKNFLQCHRNPRGISEDCQMTLARQPWQSPGFKLVRHTCR